MHEDTYVLVDHHDTDPDGVTLVDNDLLHDPTLSLVAKGLAVHILSLPDGAPTDAESLAARFPEDISEIAAALGELEAWGLLPQR